MTEPRATGIARNWDSIDIFLFSNGQEYSPPRKYHLSSEQLEWWEKTLSHMARTQYTGEKKGEKMHNTVDLYTITGKKIMSPMELKDGMTYVAVGPNEKFINAGYEDYLMRASKSREKRERRKSEDEIDMPAEPAAAVPRNVPTPLMEPSTTRDRRHFDPDYVEHQPVDQTSSRKRSMDPHASCERQQVDTTDSYHQCPATYDRQHVHQYVPVLVPVDQYGRPVALPFVEPCGSYGPPPVGPAGAGPCCSCVTDPAYSNVNYPPPPQAAPMMSCACRSERSSVDCAKPITPVADSGRRIIATDDRARERTIDDTPPRRITKPEYDEPIPSRPTTKSDPAKVPMSRPSWVPDEPSQGRKYRSSNNEPTRYEEDSEEHRRQFSGATRPDGSFELAPMASRPLTNDDPAKVPRAYNSWPDTDAGARHALRSSEEQRRRSSVASNNMPTARRRSRSSSDDTSKRQIFRNFTGAPTSRRKSSDENSYSRSLSQPYEHPNQNRHSQSNLRRGSVRGSQQGNIRGSRSNTPGRQPEPGIVIRDMSQEVVSRRTNRDDADDANGDEGDDDSEED